MTEVPGAIRIAPRALQHAVRAAAAEAFGAPPAQVRAEVVERGRSLDLRVATPVRLGETPVVEAAEAARRRLLEQAARITGAQLDRCELRITGCIAADAPRAR